MNLKQKLLTSFRKITLRMPIYLTTKSVVKVAYRADVFEHLNTLNASMQGRGHNIFEQSVKKKIALWANHVHENRLDMFPNTSNETQQLDTMGEKMH